MIRNADDLIAVYEAEQTEKDNLKAHEDLIQMLTQPGWHRFQEWLSTRRDNLFQQLRHVQGPATIIAESFSKWQVADALFEDIQDYIKNTVESAEDIRRRQRDTLNEAFKRGEIYGRPSSNTGTSSGGAPTGYTADTTDGSTDSY